MDLPLPLAPTTASTSPGATRKDAWSSTGAPRSKEKVTSSNSTSPRTDPRPKGDAVSTTSGGASITCRTRRSETPAAARPA